jgi:hypothetical protein
MDSRLRGNDERGAGMGKIRQEKYDRKNTTGKYDNLPNHPPYVKLKTVHPVK